MGSLGKKGQSVRDTFLVVAILAVMGMGFLFILYVNTEMNTALQANAVLNSTPETINVLNGLDTINNRLDYVVLVVLIGLALGMIILGWFIPVESIFFWIYILVMIFGVIFAFVFQYIWEQFSGNAVFATAITNFAITNHILTNLPVYYTIISGIALIATYGKPGQDTP